MRWLRTATRSTLTVVVALALLAALASFVDVDATVARLRATHPLVGLALLPAAVGIALDGLAHRRVLARLGSPVARTLMVQLRLAIEAVTRTMVGGPVLAETVPPWILGRRAQVSIPRSLASQAGRKSAQIVSHGLFLGLSAVLGASALIAATGSALAPWLLGAIGLLFIAIGSGLGHALAYTQLGARIDGLRARWRQLDRRASVGQQLDASLAHGARVEAGAVTLLLLAWLVDPLESLIILAALGAPLGWSELLALEAAASVLRVITFLLPGNAGAQELGYGVMLTGLIGADGAAAFAVLKRGRDVVVAAAGVLALGHLGLSRGTITEGLPA